MNIFKIATIIAGSFFSIGTLLFLLQLVSYDSGSLPVIGFFYLCTAVLVNLMVLLVLLVKLFIENHKVEILKSMGVILTNAPIAYLYAYILFEYSYI